MNKLEEVSSKQLVLVDSFDAKMNHLQILAFGLLIGTILSLYLWLICSATPSVLSALLLFGSQILIGFSAVRAFYDMGVLNKEKLHFIDPPVSNGQVHVHEIDIRLGEIPIIFEKLDLQIRNYDAGSLDDLSDLAWFAVLVWSSISSTLFYFEIGGFSICLAGTLILLPTFFGSYLSGYWSIRNLGFEDDLSHLQYYVEKRFKNLDKSISYNNYRLMVQVIEKRRSLVLADFNIEINIGESCLLEYHLGFPSSQKERIILKAESNILDSVYEALIKSRIISMDNWYIELIDTPASIKVVNTSSDFSVTTRSSYVSMPSIVDTSSKEIAQAFLEILSLAKQKHFV